MDPSADDSTVTVPYPHRISRVQTNTSARRIYRPRSNGLEPDYLEQEGGEEDGETTPRGEPSDDQIYNVLNDGKKNMYDSGWRRIVRNFSPSWFSVTMGTGAVSLLFITIPFKATWLFWLSVVFFALNTVLFATASIISILRYVLYPEIWSVMIADPNNSLFLGTIPMGFATLVEGWIFLCCPYWGDWAIYIAWGAWMLDSITALAITAGLSYMLISQSDIKSLERITAAQLLPIAATIVAAGTGAEVAAILKSPEQAIATLLANYVLWGMSMPLSLTVLVIYYSRLALHKLPPREVIVSSFLPLGPLGMGGYTILYLGKVARDRLPQVELLAHVPIAGDILYILGLFLAITMWAFGLTWLILASITIWSSRPFPFNMGWWGFTFPLAVFAISTMTIGVELHSFFFKVLGTVFGVAVMFLWGIVAAGTTRGALNGKLFYAPCLKNLPKHQQVDAKVIEAAHADTGRKA